MDSTTPQLPSPHVNATARQLIGEQRQKFVHAMNDGFDQWACRKEHRQALLRHYTRTALAAIVLAVVLSNTVPARASTDYRLGRNADYEQAVAIIKSNLANLS